MRPAIPDSMRSPQPFLGTWLSIGSPIIAEIAAISGFDWLLIDLEHGATSEATLMCNLQAIGGHGAKTIVRVGTPHPELILRVLDWGSSGIMVPHVESAEGARQCVQAMRYPPRGMRGVSRSARAYNYGMRPMSEVTQPFFLAQIESLIGVEQVEAIAAVEGVDVLFVGPADLNHDLSAQGNGQTPTYEECLLRIAKAARAVGKPSGILLRNLDDLPRLHALGFTHFAIDSDVGILRSQFQNILSRARKASGLPALRNSSA